MTETNPYNIGSQQYTQTAVGDLNMSYTHNAEGKLFGVTYPTDIFDIYPPLNAVLLMN